MLASSTHDERRWYKSTWNHVPSPPPQLKMGVGAGQGRRVSHVKLENVGAMEASPASLAPARIPSSEGRPAPEPLPDASQTISAIPISPEKEIKYNEHNEQSMEANSGVVFPHILGMKFNPTSAPKVQGFGWNLGIHYHHSRSEKSMTWIITREEWHSLFDVYLREIHCLYGFLDTETVLFKASRRWQDPHATNAYDHVLCGIAALATLFSPERTDNREGLLVDCAKEILESTSLLRDPTVHDAEAWLLRTLYLRCNSPPHAAWMASCTTMHIVEAAGLHRESADVSLVYSDAEPPEHDVERRRRLFWVAKLLNSWISFEYGRSRVSLQGASCQSPTPIPGDYTTDLIAMFQLSEVLDPSSPSEPSALENCLMQVAGFRFSLNPLTLSQSNLCFTLYRRLRLATTNVKSQLLEQVIAVGCKGLEASIRATRTNSPWWHVSNVPFQFACILLAMDTQESLSHVHQAILTLRTVVNHFKTPIAQKALATIEQLVRIAQNRKEQDMVLLQNCLESGFTQEQECHMSNGNGMGGAEDGLPDQWSTDILWNTPALGDVNWDQFWTEPLEFSTSTLPPP
ncbi:Fungal specific transcription factor domain-containing protein [Cladophialophora immunda]|nr:Fungal specific transcription factor domain-containing protein [Cladophialophora immunda]